MGEPSAEEIACAYSVQNDESQEPLLFAFGHDDVGNRKIRQDMYLRDEGWGIALSKCSLVEKENNGLLSAHVGSLGRVGATGSPDWSPLTQFSPDAEEEESPPQENFGNERVHSQQTEEARTSAAVRKYIQSGKDLRVLLCIVLGHRGIENSDFRVGPYKLIKTKRKEKIPDMEMLQCEVHDRHAQQQQQQLLQQRNASAGFLQPKKRPSFPCSSKTKKEMLRWLLRNPRQLHPAERNLFQRELLNHLDSIQTKDGLALSTATAAPAAASTESPDTIQIAIRQGALQRVQVRLSAATTSEPALTDYMRGLYGELTNSLRREIGLLRADGRTPSRCNANTTAMSKNLVLNWLDGRFAVVRNLIESTRMEQLASDIPETYWKPLQELEHQATQILQEKDYLSLRKG